MTRINPIDSKSTVRLATGFCPLYTGHWPLTILFLFMVSAATAQDLHSDINIFDTIPFIPEHGRELRAKYAAQPTTTGRTIFLGNSITEAGDWKTLTGDTTVLNRGIGGDITYGILDRLDEVIRHQPKKVFLLIGINDIGKDIPDPVSVSNILKIAARLKAGSPATQLYIQSVLPLNPDVPRFPQHYDKQDHVLRVNKLLKEACANNGLTFVNIHDLFTDKKGRLDASLTGDGLHLKPGGEGYVKWVAYLRSKKLL